MQSRLQVALLLVAVAILGGCDVGRAAKGGGNEGGGKPLPENIEKDGGAPLPENKGGGGGDALPENIDGTYSIQEINDQGVLYAGAQMAEGRQESRKVIFTDGAMTTFYRREPLVEKMEIDRTKSPAQVTFTEELPAGASQITYGVMAMEGDQLIVCRFVGRRLRFGQRPAEITNGRDYVTWKLKKE